jgi:hypothetical protein
LAEGVPFTLSVVGAGEVTEKTGRKVHCARSARRPAGSARSAVDRQRVGREAAGVDTPTKRWSEVLANVRSRAR